MIRRFGGLLATRVLASSVGALLLGIGVWFSWLSWMRPLILPDEGRYAGVAWDMYRSGSMAVPLLDGMPYFHKPPLYYWIAEAAFGLFGVSEWAARVPSWLGAWAAVAAVYAFVARYRDPATARIAALMLATIPFFFGGAQFANMDMLVAGTITLAILAGAAAVLEHAADRPYGRLMLATGAFAALALLSKGLIGIVLPVFTLVAWLAAMRQWKSLRVLLWPPAIAVFLVLGLPWFVLMQVRYPDFFHYFFIYQQFERFSETGFNNVQPFWFYVPILVGMCLPWTLWGGGLFRKAFWTLFEGRAVRLLMAAWIVVVIGFFSLPASKLVGYVLPAVPPLAILLADVLGRAYAASPRHAPRAIAAASVVSVAVCLMAAGVAPFYVKHSARPLIKPFMKQIARADTLVALEKFPFDLPFYTRTKSVMWVVDDWTNPAFALRDTWRKELADAALFAPAAGREALVPREQFKARLCAAPPGIFWIWGSPGDAARYSIMGSDAPLVNDGKTALWRLLVDARFKSDRCAGMPTGG
jgi:4-amino-4-deoxy-L-arabinose transferase-like glycosyltransferase